MDWIGLDWIGSCFARNGVDWIGLDLMTLFTIISASLSINIIEHKHSWNRVVAYPICRSVVTDPGQV